MTHPVIRVEGLGKRYVLGQRQKGRSQYRALRDDLMDAAKAPLRWAQRGFGKGKHRDEEEEFWALRDVSFKVNQGEVVGVIGRNGAGKSTLLKVLSRITEPTTGSIHLKGRVASLLEVGTGFHPELTGRENIYLNGAILGMHRSDIKAKFDEIVDFAEVERFLDTPVKRYSSGMYVRLAFAVAAHLEPEILVVDEVLAVGDAGFQKKCLGKMQDVSEREGRTILFVSHQLSIIEHFCTRGIILRAGQIAFDGTITDATRTYLKLEDTVTTGVQSLEERRDRRGAGAVRITKVEYRAPDGRVMHTAAGGMPLHVLIYYKKNSEQSSLRGVRFSIALNAHGTSLFICSTELVTNHEWTITGDGVVECVIPSLPLTTGSYHLTLFVEATGEPQDWIENAVVLNVEGGAFFPYGTQTPPGSEGRHVLVEHSWKAITQV